MIKRDTTRGRNGDYLVVDDRTGFTRWRSECVKDWQGLIVHRSVHEPRHPQDFLRARPEKFGVPDARPEKAIEDETFTGPLVTETTAAASAGASTLAVTSTSRMTAADSIGVYLQSGDLYRTTIASVDSTTGLTLSTALPDAVASGAKVIDYSATAS
jgi:hypothetical protein